MPLEWLSSFPPPKLPRMGTPGPDNSIQDTDPNSSVPARPETGVHDGPGHQQGINGRNVGPGQVKSGAEPLRLECGCTVNGRALIVCLDGTPNQFSKNNTNVFELYRRVIKNENQLTYYDSGISGTYAKRSFAHWKQVIFNRIDMATAWNFKKIILGAYRWLSANYKEGDKIYLFGFSRGAYQVRVLAAMISKVGLILPGNEDQIPFAYKLYADHKSDQYITQSANETFDMAARFKATSSRGGRIQVHFLGVWDTVSSVGVAGSKPLPLIYQCEHFCYMRHAFALDERRVKFLPEYAQGGKSWDLGPERRLGVANWRGSDDWMRVFQPYNDPWTKDKVSTADKPSLRPRVKEVWFAGSHSDIGGGIKSNTELNNTTISALWMGNEAMSAGLDLAPSEIAWNWNELEVDRPTESLSFMWRILEVLPLKHLSYSTRRQNHQQRLQKAGILSLVGVT
ncbi:hypothetical protein BD779DRAFT_1554299 [Infundibulicybe gibba]|nr:hypothetical protein BD779DRAFT_1554299 [Infundibulicybe gibba]